jgi:hypothetical protein
MFFPVGQAGSYPEFTNICSVLSRGFKKEWQLWIKAFAELKYTQHRRVKGGSPSPAQYRYFLGKA